MIAPQIIQEQLFKNFSKMKMFSVTTLQKIVQVLILKLNPYDDEILNFKQICPIEMLDKLDNPITLKNTIKKVS